MIQLILKPEPANFDSLVRQRGNNFLTSCRSPSSKNWRRHNYWQVISSDLYNIYGGICAYTGEWFPKTAGGATVDHFWPKCSYPQLAYEWHNYRLASLRANQNKDNKVGLADPVDIRCGWFILEIPSCLIKEGENISAQEKGQVQRSISVLKLNSEDYVQQRLNIIKDYIGGYFNEEYLYKKYPFIANELQRQNLLNNVHKMFRALL